MSSRPEYGAAPQGVTDPASSLAFMVLEKYHKVTSHLPGLFGYRNFKHLIQMHLEVDIKVELIIGTQGKTPQ